MSKAGLDDKDPTLDAGSATAGVGGNPKANPVVITFRTSPSIASALKLIGPCVCCPRALLMPTPRSVLRFTSKPFCAR